MYKTNDLVGRRFGNLVVESREPNQIKFGASRAHYKCICDCGATKIVYVRYLIDGKTSTCGNTQKCSFALSKSSTRFTNPDEARLGTALSIYKTRYGDGNLTFDQFMILSQLPCVYCGNKFISSYNKYSSVPRASKVAKDHGTFQYNGLDRLDSNKPHDIGNVVPCCITCNFAKSNHYVEEFLSWIECVYINTIANEDSIIRQIVSDSHTRNNLPSIMLELVSRIYHHSAGINKPAFPQEDGK